MVICADGKGRMADSERPLSSVALTTGHNAKVRIVKMIKFFITSPSMGLALSFLLNSFMIINNWQKGSRSNEVRVDD